MKLLVNGTLLATLALFIAALPHEARGSGGITPEQIFQPVVGWDSLIGTWEVLTEENPLAEKDRQEAKSRHRTLLALRKDGTCRIFDPDHPSGSDGLWTFEDHEILINLPSSLKIGFYVYGVKGDFMITRSPVQGGKDQLWSRVK